jgi:preprotein translocase subunit YajC
MEVFIQLLESFGLPVAIIVALGFFIYKIYTDTTKQNKETVTQMQEKCQAREEKLYDEIGKNREVITQAIATISKYAEKLDVIQSDVNEIKTDVIKITEKLG